MRRHLISFLTEKNEMIGRTIYVSMQHQENGGKNHVGISVSMQKFIYDPYFAGRSPCMTSRELGHPAFMAR